MNAPAAIGPEQLRQVLRYDATTGKLFWLRRAESMFATKRAWAAWNARYADKPALDCPSHGYCYGRVFGKSVFAHRAGWALHHGLWPEVIDHINGDRSDNRIENLRNLAHKDNLRNAKRSSANTSGATGVFWLARLGKWQAGIRVDGKYTYLGVFDDFQEAVSARKSAEAANGFHENHGRQQ